MPSKFKEDAKQLIKICNPPTTPDVYEPKEEFYQNGVANWFDKTKKGFMNGWVTEDTSNNKQASRE